ncbi:DUF982 domain-containing protein [Pseudorhizobium tarimense]
MIDVDFGADWGGTVSVVARSTTLHAIAGPAEAYEFLCRRWPGARGTAFAKARRTAMAALCGKSSVDEAKATFIAACVQADCLARTE